MNVLLASLLALLAKAVINKHKPFVVGVTGSVGKTTTRQAVASVLSQAFSVRTAEKNFNNEIGLPLSILGVNFYPTWNPFSWVKIFYGFLKEYFSNTFPKYLVLEYGIDREGDMDHLLGIVKPDISILTGVGISHLEFFSDMDALIAEKTKLAKNTKSLVVLNADNKVSLSLTSALPNSVTYGFTSGANYLVSHVSNFLDKDIHCEFQIKSPKKTYSLTSLFLGRPHLYAHLAAVAVGENLGLTEGQIVAGIKNYLPAERRLEIFHGIKNTIVIDDTYNAAPDSMKEALSLFAEFSKDKIAVLGDMRELGKLADEAHREIGKVLSQMEVRSLITVGHFAKLIADSAIENGFKGNTQSLFSWQEASSLLAKEIKGGEIILVKGSNALHLDNIIKGLK